MAAFCSSVFLGSVYTRKLTCFGNLMPADSPLELMLRKSLAARVDGKHFSCTGTASKSETWRKQVSGMLWHSWKLSGTAHASSQSIHSTDSGKPLLLSVVLTRPKHFLWPYCTWAGCFMPVAFFMPIFKNISHTKIEQDYCSLIPFPLCWHSCGPWPLLFIFTLIVQLSCCMKFFVR